jgi:hypothetical protein
MKKNLPLIILPLCAAFVLVFAGLYGRTKDWTNFGMCLTAGIVFIISVLLESEYRRFVRKIDKLEELIREGHKKQGDKGA